MDLQELSLKATSLLRRTGLANVSRKALVGIAVIGIMLVAFACSQFWPHESQDFVANAGSASASREQHETEQEDDARPAATQDIVVDVEGAVANPGLQTLPSGSRIGDAVDAAGGMREDAATGTVNLAKVVSDGDQIVILTKEEEAQSRTASQSDARSDAGSGDAQAGSSGKININTADATELQQLSGVGPSLSERIVEYRQANGKFKSIEDLQNVSGIGKTRFANIKDKICI